MILAAAACAAAGAAGISYLFNDDEQSTHASEHKWVSQSASPTHKSIVTAASTIVDKQGIVKCVVHPRIRPLTTAFFDPYSIMHYPYYPPAAVSPPFLNKQNQWMNATISSIMTFTLTRWQTPTHDVKRDDKSVFDHQLSLVFFWSVPLTARLWQLSTKQCLLVDKLNLFDRTSMKISIGTQNEMIEPTLCKYQLENNGLSALHYYTNGNTQQSSSHVALSDCGEFSQQSISSIGRDTHRWSPPQVPGIVSQNYCNEEEGIDELDSLSYHRSINDDVVPIGILKKKSSFSDDEHYQKRFRDEKVTRCIDQNVPNSDMMMRSMILKNVNVCVESLVKILSETCSNDEPLFIANTERRREASSHEFVSANNNNRKEQQALSMNREIVGNPHSTSFKELISPGIAHRLESDIRSEDKDDEIVVAKQFSDGIILHRGKQFGIALGEPMMRKSDEKEGMVGASSSYHSINDLCDLLSKRSCMLMRQYQIESVEDLIRLFLQQGQHRFTELMIDSFKIEIDVVERLNDTLVHWAKCLSQH